MPTESEDNGEGIYLTIQNTLLSLKISKNSKVNLKYLRGDFNFIVLPEKKKVFIVTTDSTLAYQPSILNLHNSLNNEFEVTIVSFCYYNNFTPAGSSYSVHYIKLNRLLKKGLFLIDKILSGRIKKVCTLLFPSFRYPNTLFKRLVSWKLKSYLKTIKPNEIIAVDFQALYVCQRQFGQVNFLSLEIYPGDRYQKKCDHTKIKSVIISSQERYKHLFGNADLKTFFIQNAPNFKEYPWVPEKDREGLLWAGTIDLKFGIQHLINFLRFYKQYTLTLKGAFAAGAMEYITDSYSDLIGSGQLIINKEYLENDQFIQFISAHRIGFCFYDWDLIENNINYKLGNAGRLFMYYAAGLPCIACNTIGLNSIREFNAGKLIDDYKPETIYQAILAIEENYATYSAQCLKAAKHFSFERSTAPLIKFLNDNN